MHRHCAQRTRRVPVHADEMIVALVRFPPALLPIMEPYIEDKEPVYAIRDQEAR